MIRIVEALVTLLQIDGAILKDTVGLTYSIGDMNPHCIPPLIIGGSYTVAFSMVDDIRVVSRIEIILAPPIDPKKFSFVEWGAMQEGYEGDLKCSYVDDTTANNGGKTDYYQLSSAPFPINDFDDFAEWRGMDGFQFNMGKAMWTFNVGRHEGTDEIRDLNKIIHYAKRRISKLKRSLK